MMKCLDKGYKIYELIGTIYEIYLPANSTIARRKKSIGNVLKCGPN